MQVTRSFCTALSLGVGDSALRLVADFAAERNLYGAPVDQLPYTRDVLANAYLSQWIAECEAIVAARGLHLYPTQFSSWSSVAKVQVSQLIDHAAGGLSAVLGARYYMREHHGEGMFQKFLRDGAIVSVFDGSSLVCLDSLATLLPALVRGRQAAHTAMSAAEAATLYDLGQPLPPITFKALDLFGRGRDAVLESLAGLLEMFEAAPPDLQCPSDTWGGVRVAARAIEAQLVQFDADVLACGPARPGRRNSAAQFALAQRYCALHAAISAFGLWLHSRAVLGGFFAAGVWLQAALERGGEAGFECGRLSPEQADALHAQLDRQRRDRHMFSILPWPLAKAGCAESDHALFKGTIDDRNCA